MRNILKSTLGRTATLIAVAGLSMAAIGSTGAEAREWHDGWNNGWHEGWHHYHPYWNRTQWYGGQRYYAPQYYTAPPVVYQPYYQPYYAPPPGLTFNIPLG